MDEAKHKKCEQVQELLSEHLEPGVELTEALAVAGEPVRTHIEHCGECRRWQEQTMDIVDMARSLPQFDVSEGLTQSILQKVEQEEKSKQHQLTWVVYAVAVSLFVYTMLFVDAYESVWGIGSWIVGLGTMLGLKLLIQEPKQERQVV